MQLEGTADSTNSSYWLNWRVLVCAIWVFLPMVIASLMIWKYEGLDHLKSSRGEIHQGENHNICENDAWKPCLKQVHPIWLLVFRVAAFCILLASLIVKAVISGGVMFYYYTQ